MAFFNEFKEKFNKAAQSVSSKTRDSVELTRLIGESRNISGELNSLYAQIGRTYVDCKGADTAALASLCAQVESLRERLDELERQRLQLKNQNRCPACGAAMSRDARFCSSCGQRMPEPEPEFTPAPEAEETLYCPVCGAMRQAEDAFCGVCGHSFGEEPADAAPAASDPAPQPFDNQDAEEAPDDCTAE